MNVLALRNLKKIVGDYTIINNGEFVKVDDQLIPGINVLAICNKAVFYYTQSIFTRMSSTVFYNYSLLCSRHSVILYLLPSTRFLQAVQGFFSHHPIFHSDALSDLRYLPHKYFRFHLPFLHTDSDCCCTV